MKRILRQGLLLISLLFLTACSVGPPSPTPTVDQLKQAVQKLWTARIHQDWNRVFDLTDRNYQKNHSKEEFVTTGGLKKVLSFEIKDLHQIDPLHSEVLIRFAIKKMGYTFKPVIKEVWIFEKSVGWVLDKTRMQNKKPL